MHEPEIEYLIRSLGIGATYRGYEYLIYGIRLCLSDENYLLFVSKYLYPDIARHYNTTSYSVERNIRDGGAGRSAGRCGRCGDSRCCGDGCCGDCGRRCGGISPALPW